jgi:gamma-glutamyl hydrolase
VEEARKSTHAPASYEEELELLMYNYVPTFTAKTWPEFNFDQCYFFE